MGQMLGGDRGIKEGIFKMGDITTYNIWIIVEIKSLIRGKRIELR